MSTNNQINDRKKKFLLVLPLLIIPFATLFFYALGGGQVNAQANSKQLTGLNARVPGAKLKSDSSENKLSFYQQAEKDSLKYKQARKDDPYYRQDSVPAHKDTLSVYDSNLSPMSKAAYSGPASSSRGFSTSGATLAANEQRISQKLAVLNRQISQPEATLPEHDDSGVSPLQSMAQVKSATPDPEMQQLSGMLDKIRDIQNPGLARQKQFEASEKNRGQVFPVTTGAKADPLTTLDNGMAPAVQVNAMTGTNGFYSTDNIMPADTQNTIVAVIHETQTITSGSTVKLRLSNDIFINGVLIPKDNMVYGMASLDGERLQIKISSIRYLNSLFPISLSVYDMDGLSGVYIPGAITRDVAKESADQSMQNIGFTTLNPSLGAQAATAGMTAAKSLFSRKIRLVKVQVKAGYQVLLKDEKQKQFNQ